MLGIRRKKKSVKLEWEEAPDIKTKLEHLVRTLKLSHIDTTRIFCFRTQGSKSRSYARIWSFPKIFQTALTLEPAYVIEALSKYFDALDDDGKAKVLIHELLHIPKNFSGALRPHRTNGRHMSHTVNKLFTEYKNSI